MGKSKQVFRRITLITIYVILITLSIICIKFYLDYKKKYENEEKEKKNYINQITILKEQVETNNEKIENEKLKYTNIDEQIKNKKDEFFKKAKELENKVLNGESDKKIVYLTFDDGPYLTTTDKVLNILEEKNVLATFFLLGKTKAEGIARVYEREYYSGHTLANHTYTHKISRTNGIYVSVNSFINDVKRQENFLSEKFDGYKTNIVRFPGGSPTAGSLKQGIKNELFSMKYGYVDWDLETGDGNGRDKNNSEISFTNVFDNLKDKKVVVVLMHDYSNTTIKALPKIIDEFKKRNFVILPLFYDSVKVIKN